MKSIKVTDVGSLKNELNKYKKGKKLGIGQFNQAARLAWLGKIVMSALDPEDSDNRAWLLYVQPLEGLATNFIEVDEELLTQIHILDAEQGLYLTEILRDGMVARAKEFERLNQRDFYFGKFFKSDENKADGQASDGDAPNDDASAGDASSSN